MRILLSAIGTRGDVQPLVVLGLGLQRAGHEARFVGSPAGCALAEAWGLPSEPLGVDIGETLHALVTSPPKEQRALWRAYTAGAQDRVIAQLTALEAHAREVDAVIGSGGAHAASTVAELHNRPFVGVVIGPAQVPSAAYPPPLVPWQGLPQWVNQGLWFTQTLWTARPEANYLRAIRRKRDLPVVPEWERLIYPPGRLLYTADARLAPPPRDFDPQMTEVGWLHPLAPPEPLPESLRTFLEQDEPPLYIGFGSMTDAEPHRTTSLLMEAVSASGRRCVLQSGRAGLGLAVPPWCRVVGAVDHRALFPHVAAVVHHGGSGTTGAAAWAGQPQLAVPHFHDQFAWGAQIARAGVGPTPLPRSRLSTRRLIPKLEALLQPELSASADEMGAQIRDRDSLAEAVSTVERWIGAPEHRTPTDNQSD